MKLQDFGLCGALNGKTMKLTHLQKLRLARRMQAPFERSTGKNAFSSLAWAERIEGRRKRELSKNK